MGKGLALLLVLAAFDVTPKGGEPEIAPERLGSNFSPKGDEADRGLAVSVWRNNTLNREERWHYTEKGEWFLRARDGVFVLAEIDSDKGEWKTRPSERLVWRRKAWSRITVPPR
jgi:hypothetical protein